MTRPSTCTISPGSIAPGRSFSTHRLILAVRDEADVLAVRLFRDAQTKLARQRAYIALRQTPKREAQIVELRARGGEQEIGLIAAGVGGAVQLRRRFAVDALHVMARRQAIGAEIFGDALQDP